MPEKEDAAAKARIGLCAECRFARIIVSDRGSRFYFCDKSAVDPSFPKYPRLPVLRCAGYEIALKNRSGEST